ncbi:hypothetical protein [Coleofasciculus sp. G2-EDA-02]
MARRLYELYKFTPSSVVIGSLLLVIGELASQKQVPIYIGKPCRL